MNTFSHSNSARRLPAFVSGLLHGLMLTFLAFSWIFWHYEAQIIGNILTRVDHESPTSDPLQRALNLNRVAYQLIDSRRQVLGLPSRGTFRENWFGSVDTELVEGRSACGGYAMVLGRLLEQGGFRFRLGQMRCGDIWGCHIFVEAWIDERWIALDPTFGIAFQLPDGQYASAQQLRTRFAEVAPSLPAHYDRQYRFEDFRYTNWGKIPVLLPAFRTVASWFIGEQRASEISLRSYVLNRYRAYFIGAFSVYLVWLSWSLWRLLRQRNKYPALN